jgi:hypothetical protein
VTASKTYRQRQRDIADFAAALTRLLDVCEQHGSLASFPTWAPQPGHESEAAQLAATVDVAAGRAALAFGSDFYIDWKPRGTWQTQPVSPASGWRTILDSDPHFDVQTILAVCNQAIGALDAAARQAEEHEQSLAGKLGWVTGRSRGGGSGSSSAGGPQGFVVAFAVALVAALVAAYLAFRFGWV